MPDYKQLFYKSQAEIADIIEQLSQLEDRLKKHMTECEEKVIDSENNVRGNTIEINTQDKN